MKKKIVKITNCQNIFKFGDGRKTKLLQKAKVPVSVTLGTKIVIEIDVLFNIFDYYFQRKQ